MAPNTPKQQALRRIEKAVGATMPPKIYNPLSLIPARDIHLFAEWLENVLAGKHKDEGLPLDDIDV